MTVEDICYVVSVRFVNGKSQNACAFESAQEATDYVEHSRREAPYFRGDYLIEPLFYQRTLLRAGNGVLGSHALDKEEKSVVESRNLQREVLLF